MGRPTKEQDRALFMAEFLRRLRAAAPGERVYMRASATCSMMPTSSTLTSGRSRGPKTTAALATANRLGVA